MSETALHTNRALLPRLSGPLRLTLVAVVGAGLAALVIVVAGGFSRAPGVAVMFGGVLGMNAPAQANRAQLLLAGEIAKGAAADSRVVSDARSDALGALSRDFLLPEAWRTVAVSRNPSATTLDRTSISLLQAANTVSRRDVPTNILLFRHYAATGRVSDAYRHLDLALRRSAESRKVLMPLLVRGIEDRTFRDSFAKALARDTEWRDVFFEQLSSAPPAEDAVIALFNALPAQLISEDRQKMALVAATLVQKGALGAAKALTRRLFPAKQVPIDGGFEHVSEFPPLTWAMQSNPDYDAGTGSYGGKVSGQKALFLRSSLSSPVEVARQIVFLDAGRYSLSALAGKAGGQGAERVSVVLACVTPAGGVGRVLGQVAFAGLGDRQAASTGLAVPGKDCVGQWLLVMVTGGGSDIESGAWIDDIRIQKVGRAVAGP